jgi:flagellar basal-body rod protein FlgB
MIDKLGEAFNFHREALNLRHQRQSILASNIANADTPHYKARDIDFASELSRALKEGPGGTSSVGLRTTSPQHFRGGALASAAQTYDMRYRVPVQPSLDGNTVDMDQERAHFTDNAVRYQASLTLLNGYIQGLRNAMQD